MTAPVGTLARVAVLLDAVPTNTEARVIELVDTTHQTAQFLWTIGTQRATINQVDPATNTLTPPVTYLSGRGVLLPSEENLFLTSGNATPLPLLTLTPSQIKPGFVP